MAHTEKPDWWVIEVESSLEGKIEVDVFTDGQGKALSGLIYKVPQSLLSENTEMFYLPQVLFTGPYHFIGKDKPAFKTESLKSDVARFVHLKIKDAGQQSRNQDEIKETKREGYIKNESGIKIVIKNFMRDEEKVRNSYANKDFFKLGGEVCAWMMARDACFVIHVLERFRDDEDEHNCVSAKVDSILSRKRYNPELTNIVQDLLKMENQLPFWALQAIRPGIGEWVESALKNLSPIKVAYAVEDRLYACTCKSESHILKLLHDYIIDRQVMRIPADCLSALVFPCKFYFGPSCYNHRGNCESFMKSLVWRIILLVLSPLFFIVNAIWKHITTQWSKTRKTRKIQKIRKHVPTVEKLKSVGVRFERWKGKKKGISHIKFTKRNSTLYLPQLEVDHTSEVILRNLIALEICSNEKEKPITSYVILMNDLIDTGGDVLILTQNGIMSSKLGSDEKTAKFWNSMVISTEMPRYDPIDTAVSSMYDYRKNRRKAYWAQFVTIRGSRPWLVPSLLAGILMLIFSFLQVLCLFVSCQIK